MIQEQDNYDTVEAAAEVLAQRDGEFADEAWESVAELDMDDKAFNKALETLENVGELADDIAVLAQQFDDQTYDGEEIEALESLAFIKDCLELQWNILIAKRED